MTDAAFTPEAASFARINDLIAMPDQVQWLRARGLDSLDALFDVSDAESLSKPGLGVWRERLRLSLPVKGEPRAFYLKRFSRPPLRVHREVRQSGSGAGSVAGLEWTWMHRLAADGIACLRPVAFGQQLRGARELRSAILTQAVPGESLERWIRCESAGTRETMPRLLKESAELVGRFHACGYVHRDLYLSHLFFDAAAAPGRGLHLIDLQRVLRPRWRPRRWIVKDLASLAFSVGDGLVSKTDRLRWLIRYLQASGLEVAVKPLAYRIAGKTGWIARHDRRRAGRRNGSDRA